MGDVDISNDPEIERLGANATAVYALQFWEKLTDAARKDGRVLDPLFGERAGGDGTSDCHYTKKLVLTDSSKQDYRLYQRFRSNFGGFNVLHLPMVSSSSTSNDSDDCFGPRGQRSNPLGGERWQTLLLAAEGQVPDYNFITLLRTHANDMFWMTEKAVCDGLAVVSRAQFLYIELARIQEGCYGSEFRKALQLFDVLTQTDILRDTLALDLKDESVKNKAMKSLDLVQAQWPNPSNHVLKQTGIVKLLKRGMGQVDSKEFATKCESLLKFWQDLKELAKIPRTLGGNETTNAAVRRAGMALIQQSQASNGGSNIAHDGAKYSNDIIASALPICSLEDLTVKNDCDSNRSSRIFRQNGMLLVQDLISPKILSACQKQAREALDALVKEQLEPRGLKVDGMEEFDFAEVRQRPGHRVDNRYQILDDPSSPIAELSRQLQETIPKFWKDNGFELCYGGVVHSFPREKENDPLPPAQIWHRDGPSILSHNHDTHCFNVFIPLIDVTTENGTTELIPGTHVDSVYEDLAVEVIPLAQRNPSAQHERALRAQVPAGSVLVFDVRVLHRGLANASMKERPMLYFTFGKDWFHERFMFSKSSLRAPPQLAANQRLVNQVYGMVAGKTMSSEKSSHEYGHPHYTSRFDWLLLEQFKSDDESERTMATQNAAAVMAFALSSEEDKEVMAREFVESLNDDKSVKRKRHALEEAQVTRRSACIGLNEDFSSITEDMSDVGTLYSLTAKILLEESTMLSKLGFSVDQEGLCVLLAMLKARAKHASTGSVEITWEDLEEAFTSWWHGGHGRFTLRLKNGDWESAVPNGADLSQRKVLVVFSSLGSGLARPEWIGSLHNVVSSLKNLDVLHVMDPAFSWYCQDPTCQWKGGDYYKAELAKIVSPYKTVMFLGDSMGAAAALRFSELADHIVAFTPQVNISSYEAITRLDFSLAVKTEFTKQLVESVGKTNATVSIHYGKHCEEDVRQIKMLPTRSSIELVEYDYDDHILSLHLRDIWKLADIIETAVGNFAR
jgi:hypothetical protein